MLCTLAGSPEASLEKVPERWRYAGKEVLWRDVGKEVLWREGGMEGWRDGGKEKKEEPHKLYQG